MSSLPDTAPIVSSSGSLSWKPLPLQSGWSPVSAQPVIGIALEEHVQFSSFSSRLPQRIREGSREFGSLTGATLGVPLAALEEVGTRRLAAMDQSCTAIQVLSVAGAGAPEMDGEEAVTFAREYNDEVAKRIRASPQPNRLLGFAHLPAAQPTAAASELERCVRELDFVGALINGMVAGKFLDDPMFQPLLEAAERLDVPIYLHPALPPDAVKQAYMHTNERFTSTMAGILSAFGWGWHQEVGLHVLRLCYSGTLDRHPKLKLIIGHHGEMIPMMMHREDHFAQDLGTLKRPISAMLREQVWVTISGMFTMPPLRCAIDTFGPDHVCWSVDYPYLPLAVEQAQLYTKMMADSMSAAQLQAIMYANAKKLLKL